MRKRLTNTRLWALINQSTQGAEGGELSTELSTSLLPVNYNFSITPERYLHEHVYSKSQLLTEISRVAATGTCVTQVSYPTNSESKTMCSR